MILGITGGIATGKSTATQVLAQFGVRIIDADEISRYLATYDHDILTAIRARFGDEVFYQHGALNRRKLAEVVVADAVQRTQLEGILHPAITRIVRSNLEYAQTRGEHIVHAAPLLIEAGLQSEVDRLWVISASRANQLSRLSERLQVDEQVAGNWIDSQMPLEQKKKLADLVIANDGTITEFQEKVRQAWQMLVAADE